MSFKGFSKHTAVVLENADRKIRSLSGGNRYLVYHFWRLTMEKICRVDAFYVGFFQEGNRIFYPYSVDVTGYDDPEELTYGEDGICAWMQRNKRPYTYSQDNGFLLHNGQRFGDLTKASSDAVVIPLFDAAARTSFVVGMASMQSYKPNSYNTEAVRAFQWLGQSVTVALARQREDAINRRELGVSETERYREGPVPEVAGEINRGMRDLRQRVEQLREKLTVEDSDLRNGLAELQFECEQLQTNIVDLLTRPVINADDLLDLLTVREKQIAALIARDYTNKQIADELEIDVETVKTHVSRILEKFGVRQRAAVALLLDPVRRDQRR